MNQLNLKRARQQCAVKQEVVALTMEITKSAVSKLESKSANDLPLKKLSKYVDALGGSVCVEITLPNGESYSVS